MNKQFKNELKKLCKKYNINISESCLFCGHSKESMDLDLPESHFITLTPNKSNKKK